MASVDGLRDQRIESLSQLVFGKKPPKEGELGGVCKATNPSRVAVSEMIPNIAATFQQRISDFRDKPRLAS